MLQVNHCQIKTKNSNISLPNIGLAAGELLVVTGPSGMGKSTLLHWILGEKIKHAQITGEILLDDKPITALNIEQRRIGLLMQDVHLFPHLTVIDNICFALPRNITGQNDKKLNKQQRRELAKSMLDNIDMGYVAQHYSEQLSGGERSRVGLIRALANEPQAFLMDEPFAALDQKTAAQVSHWAFEQLRKRGIPSIMVSHDIKNIPAHGQQLDLANYLVLERHLEQPKHDDNINKANHD